MASIRKRELPSGEIRWQVDYRDSAGARRSKQFEKKAEAVAYETRARSEVANGIHVADSASITVAAAALIWIDRCEADGLQRSTTKQYDEHRRLHINPLLGAIKLSQLTTPRCEAFKDELIKTRSRALARAVLTSLKSLIDCSRRLGLAATNPAEAIKIDKRRSEDDEDAQVVIPSKNQIKAMVVAAPALWPLTKIVTTRAREQRMVAVPWRALSITAIFTAMRQSELRGLAWPYVDFKAGIIRVRQRADAWGTIGPVKTKTSRRDIPMSPLVASTLREWKVACPKTDLDLVFPSASSGVLSATNVINQGFRPLMIACGIVDDRDEPLLHFHCLRHAGASLFIDQGWTPKKVQTVLGHSSIQVTFDIYGHLFPSPDDDQTAMANLEARLLG